LLCRCSFLCWGSLFGWCCLLSCWGSSLGRHYE
jgi:hypothetical protein